VQTGERWSLQTGWTSSPLLSHIWLSDQKSLGEKNHVNVAAPVVSEGHEFMPECPLASYIVLPEHGAWPVPFISDDEKAGIRVTCHWWEYALLRLFWKEIWQDG
jgi:hypothetical protein